MERILIITFIVLCALSPAKGQTAKQDAARAMEAGARHYEARRFAEAQQHFERALELDPSHKSAQFFIARSIQAQYRFGVDTPENRAKAEAAIEAYIKFLEAIPGHDTAFTAVAALYRQLREDEKENKWLLRWASSDALSKERRSDAYTVLANREWNCSYDITEHQKNKQIVRRPNAVVVEGKKPQDVNNLRRAQQCVARGMELIEQAINLNASNPAAWSYKANLLREMAKLVEIDGNKDQGASYNQRADEAEAARQKLTGETARERPPVMNRCRALITGATQVEPENASRDAPTSPSMTRVVTGGVRNGRAISKPQSAYPAEVKEASASVTVTVQIVVGESGEVLSAQAVGGHPSLQQAAICAAYRTQFLPTRLSGQAVKVSGVVTYNFALQ